MTPEGEIFTKQREILRCSGKKEKVALFHWKSNIKRLNGLGTRSRGLSLFPTFLPEKKTFPPGSANDVQ